MQRIAVSDLRTSRRIHNGSERWQNGSERWQNGKPKVSLIIPTLEEAENLKFVPPAIPEIVDELIIVDGGSTDST